MSAQRHPLFGKEVLAWSLYDFANSAFTTLVATFIYATYFTQAMAPDEVTGTTWWSRAIAVSGLLIGILSPIVGALADQGGRRRQYLIVCTLLSIVCTTGLYFIGPEQAVAALVCFVAANVCFEVGYVFYNSFLPDISAPENIGRVSGLGWGAGYFGGLLCLGLALAAFVYPEQPLFGLSRANGEHIRATNLLVAAWFGLFSLPMFLLVRDRPAAPARVGVADALAQLGRTLREIRRFRHAFRLLIAHLAYNDGLITLFAFGGIYASGTFGFTFRDITIFGIALNVSAGLGALVFGFLDDRVGGRNTILLSLVGLIAATVVAVLTESRSVFWGAGIAVGLLAGPVQSASRSLLGRFTPPDRESEFFGLYALSGRATAFIGPLLLGILTDVFNNQRAGVSVLILFFIVGLLLMLPVNERAGIEAAGAHPTS